MKILVTGAAGKVGSALIPVLLRDFPQAEIRALIHNRALPPVPRVEQLRGSLADRAVCAAALHGVTHVVHLATCKEVPEDVMDVTVKGLFWLLESFRSSASAERFVLIGGDAAVGHFFHRHPQPITETAPYMAYPGCYPLSKVLEEVMVQQFGVQYGLDWCCLRAPWIMADDDFRMTLSFGDDLFGGPDWKTMVSADAAEQARRTGAVPVLEDADGLPLKRNFVHVSDLVSAIALALVAPQARQRLYNICMTEPVDYAEVANYLAQSHGLPSLRIKSRYVSNWMDNARAKAELGWRPAIDLKRLIDASWAYERSTDNPRRTYYPG